MSVQEITSPSELELAREVERRLEMIPPLLEKHGKLKLSNAQVRSQMRADDDATAWMQMSHTVGHCLDMAADNLATIHRLLLPGGRLLFPQFAHYPILRSALEASSQALWILRPAEQKDRVVRLLQARWGEASQDFAMKKAAVRYLRSADTAARHDSALTVADKTLKKHQKQIVTIADRFGISSDAYERGIKGGFDEVIRVATESPEMSGYGASALWRIISGLSHPSTSRAVNFSTLEEVSESENGVVRNMLTTNVGLVHISLLAAMANFATADNVLRVRMVSPASERGGIAT